MCFGLPGNHTIDHKWAKTIQIRTTVNEKTHFTVVLVCMANETKLKPEDHTSCHPRWPNINAATSGCGATQAFQRQNETEMDGLGVYRRQEADKGWQPEETQPIHGDHMGEREYIPAEMVKKSFLHIQQHGWD